MLNLKAHIEQLINDSVTRIVISNPFKKTEHYKKIVAEKSANGYHVSKYTEKQVFHDNVKSEDFLAYLIDIVFGHYRQVNGWSNEKEHIILVSQKGISNYKVKSSSVQPKNTENEEHNRKKNYILNEGEVIEPLIDMGIFTREGKIINSMYSKFKQINRFLEIIDDEIDNSKLTSINVIDFGCGKSYLTFVLYYYLHMVKKIEVNMIGLDLKSDVIEKCNKAAIKYGYHGLHFELGDINGYKAPFEVDMVISLHACDTATDYALYNAIQWNAKYIFSVPCCQHELNSQLKPQNLGILSRYGIIGERFSALATDAIRANLLEYCGYKTQLLEFIELDHTPKNILIRAVKRTSTTNTKKETSLAEIVRITDEFGFRPTLCNLVFKK